MFRTVVALFGVCALATLGQPASQTAGATLPITACSEGCDTPDPTVDCWDGQWHDNTCGVTCKMPNDY